MSRRYGRNQKRAARARIEQLEREAVAANRDLRLLRCSLADKTDALEAVAEVVGVNHIGLPPHRLADRIIERAIEDGADSFRMLAPDDGILPMHALRMSCHQRSESPLHSIHFYVSLAGKDAVYVLSEPAIHQTPPRYLAQRLAAEMASFLVAELQARGGR